MDNATRQLQAGRDGRGRFVRGVSGNPAGRPVGLMSEAQRTAALLLGGEAGALTRKAIELALEGDRAALRLCLDRIIAPQREQPAAFALPVSDGAASGRRAMQAAPHDPSLDPIAALAALVRAAASGAVTPSAAEALARVLEAQTRVAALAERRAAERIAARHAELAARLELRVCVVMAALIRDFHHAGALFDPPLQHRCEAILRIGRTALETLATIPETSELAASDNAFLKEHPLALVRQSGHPLGAAMLEAWTGVAEYLDCDPGRLRSLDRRMDELAARNTAAALTDSANSTGARPPT